jgi:hypothetical protein
MSERGKRWGVLPSYWSYQGQLVETSAETEAAFLAAMGASGERPPRARRFEVPKDPCAPAPDRAWGWAVQLYAVRSRDSWGIGDMADLRRLAQWSRKQGASLILLNPLGAQTPTHPYQASPYYSSSRRFRNTMYLRIDEVDGAEQCAEQLEPLRTQAQKLNDERLIDYDEVFSLKSKALEEIFRAAPEPRGLAPWTRGKGRALRDFATYNALAEAHGPAWRSWPSTLRHPTGEGVDAEPSTSGSSSTSTGRWLVRAAKSASSPTFLSDSPQTASTRGAGRTCSLRTCAWARLRMSSSPMDRTGASLRSTRGSCAAPTTNPSSRPCEVRPSTLRASGSTM